MIRVRCFMAAFKWNFTPLDRSNGEPREVANLLHTKKETHWQRAAGLKVYILKRGSGISIAQQH
ncbi:hypothetical protein GGC63_001846 [Paenibacillus sp. OAS669]|nr:hypothetical protein [Paenibacillus sp. OAS669]